jgi:RpiR family carbohydrate utilization transcriptional regulator
MKANPPHQGLSVLYRLQSTLDSLGTSERRLATYILENNDQLIHLPITELAEKAGVSEATVFRVCKKAGFRGYQDLKISLAQEIVSPLESIHEEIKAGDDTATVMSKVFNSTIQTLQFTQRVIDPERLSTVVDRIAEAKVVDAYGLGNSAAVALDLQHKLSRAGITARAATDNHLQMIYASTIPLPGTVIGISHSGSSRDVVEALEVAKEHGATTVCLTNYARSPITKVADICLFTASEETQYRVLGLSSRIAQLTIIDTIMALLALKDVNRSRDITNSVLSNMQKKMY